MMSFSPDSPPAAQSVQRRDSWSTGQCDGEEYRAHEDAVLEKYSRQCIRQQGRVQQTIYTTTRYSTEDNLYNKIEYSIDNLKDKLDITMYKVHTKFICNVAIFVYALGTPAPRCSTVT